MNANTNTITTLNLIVAELRTRATERGFKVEEVNASDRYVNLRLDGVLVSAEIAHKPSSYLTRPGQAYLKITVGNYDTGFSRYPQCADGTFSWEKILMCVTSKAIGLRARNDRETKINDAINETRAALGKLADDYRVRISNESGRTISLNLTTNDAEKAKRIMAIIDEMAS